MKAHKLIEPKWYAAASVYGAIVSVAVSTRFELFCLVLVEASLIVCFSIYEINKYRIRTRYTIPIVIKKLNSEEDSAMCIALVGLGCLALLLAARYYLFFWR